jgi:Phosphopantetheinyl transferase
MGLYLRKELKNGAEISLWEITETEEELLSIISIPNDELEELDTIKSGARRREKLAVRALLNTIFEEKVYLGHHENGSPFIQNNPIHISISHTTDFVAIITHPTEDVGIDVECLNRDFSAVEKKGIIARRKGGFIGEE